MTAFLKIINTSGTILIDDNYPVPVVKNKGSRTIPAEGYFYVSGGRGKVALRCAQPAGFAYFNQEDPMAAGTYVFGVPGAQIDWWLYDQISEPASNFGLIIRNANGQLMYDAVQKPVRIADIRSSGARPGWQGSVTLPGGRDYAVMPLVSAFDSVVTFTRVGAGGPDQYFQREDVSLSGGSVNGNVVTMAMTQSARRTAGPYTGAQLPTGYSQSTNNAALAVVDVTAY